MRVRAKDCVLASWNMMIPYLVPELPEAQKAALHKLVKTPLVYTSVALNNWRRSRSSAIQRCSAPGRLLLVDLAQPAGRTSAGTRAVRDRRTSRC